VTTALDLAPGRSLADWSAEAEAAAGIARALAGTAFIPDSLKIISNHGLDVDATVAQVAAALLTGQELGLSPMASLRSIDVIPPGSGAPALRAAALRGLLQHHGHEIWVVESTDTRAVVRGRRAGSDIVQESVWTFDRAKKMDLRGFNDPRGSWRRQPAAMLVARATAECARWIASDVLLGLPYISEEIAEQPEDGAREPIPPGPQGDAAASPPAVAAGPRRRAARRSPSQAPAPGSARPAALMPPTPAAATPDESAPGTPDPPPPISDAQRAALWASMRRLGISDRAEALATVSGWVGRDISSSNQLTEGEASDALTAAAAAEARAAVQAGQDAEAEAAQEDADEPA
jgi:hypothetical protein